MNILIVENSPRMRRTIRTLLAGLPHEVFECENGRQALAAYQTNRPDWVLMDIGLKDIDGIVATAMLKAAHPEAKVVIVTDYDDALLRQAAQHAGACAYVLKEELFELRVIINAPPATQVREQIAGNMQPSTK